MIFDERVKHVTLLVLVQLTLAVIVSCIRLGSLKEIPTELFKFTVLSWCSVHRKVLLSVEALACLRFILC